LAKKLDRLYIRVDAQFPSDERYQALPYRLRDSAYLFFEALNGWSRDKKTDGHVPLAVARAIGRAMEHAPARVDAFLDALAAPDVALVRMEDEEVFILKYSKWQDTAEEIDRHSAAGRAGGQASGRARNGSGGEPNVNDSSNESFSADPTIRSAPGDGSSSDRQRFVNDYSSQTETETVRENPATTGLRPYVASPHFVRGVMSAAGSKVSEPPPPPDPIDDLAEGLCRRMRELVSERAKQPTITAAWRHDARLLLTRDHRPYDEAVAVMEWAAEDTFWRRNVLGIPKFRDQYDRLLMQMHDEPGAGASRPGRTDTPATIQARRLDAMAADLEARGE
jgi:hypothetical protein